VKIIAWGIFWSSGVSSWYLDLEITPKHYILYTSTTIRTANVEVCFDFDSVLQQTAAKCLFTFYNLTAFSEHFEITQPWKWSINEIPKLNFLGPNSESQTLERSFKKWFKIRSRSSSENWFKIKIKITFLKIWS
jgi:hypothetical protein